MTEQSAYWINPRTMMRHPDTVIFDVDGVLLDEKPSFRQAVIATVDLLTAHLGAPRVTVEEVAAFKMAGGLNNDWDLSYTLVALQNARYRDACGATQWPALTALAEESRGGGVGWVRACVPVEALPDYEVVKQVLNEFYWGTDLIVERLGQSPRFLTSHRGFVRDEPALVPPDFFAALHERGVEHFGIITGRNQPEWQMGVEMLRLGEVFGCVLTDEDVQKPDPMALLRMADAFRPSTMLYVGDTRDDLDLVKNFVATAPEGAPLALSAVVAPKEQWAYWQGLEADVLVSATPALLAALDAIT